MRIHRRFFMAVAVIAVAGFVATQASAATNITAAVAVSSGPPLPTKLGTSAMESSSSCSMRCVEAAVGLALLTSVSCSEKEGSTLEEIQLMLNQPPIPGLSCPKGPRELQALWSTSVYDKGNRPRTPIWYAGQLPAGSWPPTNC